MHIQHVLWEDGDGAAPDPTALTCLQHGSRGAILPALDEHGAAETQRGASYQGVDAWGCIWASCI